MPPSPAPSIVTAPAASLSPPSQSYGSDEARLAAVRGRDGGADGRFVYSVATTGVYCRPSCAARPARRENIAFHADGAAARAAGFRPCKRCRPDEPPLAARHATAIAAACRTIEEAEEAPSLAALAEAAGMSPYYFHRVFKASTGVTPKAYASARRAARLRAGLESGERVTDAIFDAGYGSSSRFYEHAGERLGMTPAAFRDGGPRCRAALRRRPLLARRHHRGGKRPRHCGDRARATIRNSSSKAFRTVFRGRR